MDQPESSADFLAVVDRALSVILGALVVAAMVRSLMGDESVRLRWERWKLQERARRLERRRRDVTTVPAEAAYLLATEAENDAD